MSPVPRMRHMPTEDPSAGACMRLAFLQSGALVVSRRGLRTKGWGLSVSERRRPRQPTCPLQPAAVAQPASSRGTKKRATGGRPATAGALERASGSERYVDLRSLKRVGWHDVRVAASSPPGCRFGPFDVASAVAALDDDALFGPDTVALSPPQEAAVRALLSRRSVLLSAFMPNREALVIDLAARAKEWQQTIVYCAPSSRAAEAMYALLCTHQAGEKSVSLDLGYDRVDPKSSSSLVITVPRVLRRAVVDESQCWWMAVSDLVMLDDILLPGIMEWEEILLNMPNRVLLCLFASDISPYERDELPLWLEAIQNSVVPIAGNASWRFIDRVDRSLECPPVRAFVYNAARHAHPVQLSLSLALEELRKDFAVSKSSSSSSAPGRRETASSRAARNIAALESPENGDFEAALLKGVEILRAKDVKDLAFEDPSHGIYADVAALVAEDAGVSHRVANRNTGSTRKRPAKTRRRSTTIQTAALKRRKRAESSLLPALVFAHGRQESELAAGAILSAVADESVSLVLDEETSDLLGSVLDEFRKAHEGLISNYDSRLIQFIRNGVGIVHDGVLPSLRSLAEELFRDGFIPVLCVDSYIGPREVASIPRARSVLVQASAIGEQSHAVKGVIKGPALGALAGRPGMDDVGNVIGMWYDEDVSDAEASSELTTSLLASEVASREAVRDGGLMTKTRSTRFEAERGSDYPSLVVNLAESGSPGRRRSGAFLTTYSGLLASIRLYGYDGHMMVADYTLDSYRSWLVGAGVRATREKVEVEKRAVDEHLLSVDWNELAMHDRIEAKLNEQIRLYRAMATRKQSVLHDRLLQSLKCSAPGTVIGLRSRADSLRAVKARELPAGEWNGSVKEPASSGIEESDALSMNIVLEELDENTEDIVPALLVSVFDGSDDKTQPCPVQSSVLIVCVLVDSMWTVVPIEDVSAVMSEKCIAPDLASLSVPHLATFDLDPITRWGKSKPVADLEAGRIDAAAEILVKDLTTSKQISREMKPLRLDEFESQIGRVRTAKQAYERSAWRGREEEMGHLRRLRRRAVELGDEAESLRNLERRIERSQRDVRAGFDTKIRSMLAVLEDCNSISVPADGSLEMTPIGVLASVMPGPYPVFAAACLLLTSGLGELTPPQLAAVMSILVGAPDRSSSSSKSRGTQLDRAESRGDSREEEYHGPRRNMGETWEVDDLLGVLPLLIVDGLEQIRSALLAVQRRHVDLTMPLKATSWIAPRKLSTTSARSLHNFVSGEWDWEKVVQERAKDAGDLVREFRNCAEGLSVISQEESALGELSDLESTTCEALEALQVWPIVDSGDVLRLSKSGVSGSRIFGVSNRTASYRAWWERAGEEFETAKKESEVEVEVAEAELVSDTDTSDDMAM